MQHDLVEAIAALAQVVAEENEILRVPGYHAGLGELVTAKLRLVGIVEAGMVRQGEAWSASLAPEGRDDAARLLAEVMDLLGENARLLERRIALCDDLLGVIAAEARRLTGGRSSTYGAMGRLAHVNQSAPIAVNASL